MGLNYPMFFLDIYPFLLYILYQGITMNGKNKKELEKIIVAYQSTIADLNLRLQELDTKKHRLIQSTSDIKGYLEHYKTELKNLGIQSNEVRLIDTSKMSTPEAVVAVLKNAGSELHVKQITKLVVDGGKKINSEKKQNVVYATIVKKKKLFERVGPNIFDLVKEG